MDRGHILAILHQIQRWSELSCPAVSNIAGGSWDTPVFVGLRDRWPWGFFRARRSGRSKSSLGMLRREDKHGSGGKVPQKMFFQFGLSSKLEDKRKDSTSYFWPVWNMRIQFWQGINSSNGCFNHIEMPRRSFFCAWTIGCWSWFHAKSTSGAVNLYHFFRNLKLFNFCLGWCRFLYYDLISKWR